MIDADTYKRAMDPPRETKLTTLLAEQHAAAVAHGVDHPVVTLYGATIARLTGTSPPPADRLREARHAAKAALEGDADV